MVPSEAIWRNGVAREIGDERVVHHKPEAMHLATAVRRPPTGQYFAFTQGWSRWRRRQSRQHGPLVENTYTERHLARLPVMYGCLYLFIT